MRPLFFVPLILAALLAHQLALAAPKDDIDQLRGFQRALVNLGSDFGEISKRFQETRDARSAEIANSLNDITLLITLQLEPLKDAIVGLKLLKCDKTSQDYFREVAMQRFGEGGVQAFLDIRIREISTWISLSKDARLIAQANRLRDTLQSVRETVISMRQRYS
jgi:hypothetical protein